MPPKPRDFQVLALEGSVQTPLGGHNSERRKTPRGGYATSDDSFIRHDTYFFKDGNITFLVGGTLYCVHRYFFSRDSVYFSTRLAQLDIRDHEALLSIISIGNIERNDFEALLSVLYPVNFEAHELSYEQWKSVLHLSTLWGFASLRKLALKSIKPPTPHDQLVLARTYSVDQWVLPALAALCSRTLPLRLDEAREMGVEDIILVATIREEIRGGTLRVDVADIPSHIEMALAGKLNHPMGNDTSWDCPRSETTGQGSDSTTASGVNPNVEVEDAKTIGVALPSGPQQGSAKEGGTNKSDVERSLNGVAAESPGEDARQQPHVVEDTPQVCPEEAVATPAMQTGETRKSEETPHEAAASPMALAQATFTMGAFGQKPLVLLRPIRGLPGKTEGPMKDKLAPEAMAKAEAAEEQTKVKAVEDKKTIKAESVGLHAMQDGHIGEGKDDQTQNTTAALSAEDLTEPTAPQLGHSSLASSEANITSTTSMSSSGTLADDAQASILEDWDSVKLTKAQKKRMRDKARKQAQMGIVANSLPCQCSVCQRCVSLAC